MRRTNFRCTALVRKHPPDTQAFTYFTLEPAEPAKNKIKQYLSGKNFIYDTVQLAYERTKAYTEHSSKKFELVKGWSGNGERFEEEMYIRHEINSKHIKRMESFQKVDVLFSNNIIPEVKRWANKFPSQQKMQSYGQILFVRILLHPKIFLQEK